MRTLLAFALGLGLATACSAPPKPAPVELVKPAPVEPAPADEVEVDPSPDAIAALRMLDGATFEGKPVTLAISILARQRQGLPHVLGVLRRPPSPALAEVQGHAMRELAKRALVEPGDRPEIVKTLLAIVERPAGELLPSDPQGGKKLYILLAGPAFEGLADLHAPEAVEPALRAMVRYPALFAFVKRALVAAGPTAKAALVQVLRGDHTELNRLIRDEKLDQFCPAPAAGKPVPCRPLAVRDHYAADILGHFYDPATVPDLLAALKRKPLPYYFTEHGKPGELTQQFAIFDALRRIGAEASARPLEALWSDRRTPPTTRLVALASYPFVSGDQAIVKKLTAIVTAPGSPADLRREAAIAISRQSRDLADVKTIRKLAAGAAKDYQLLYLAPIPRIAIAAKCKDDLACYAATERMTADELVQLVAPHMREVETFEPLEREELLVVAIDRAVFELRRAGATAAGHVDVLLELAASDRRELRHFGSLALPRVAPSPCPACVTALDRAIVNAKQLDAVYDLTLVRDHFYWAGKQP